MLDDLLGSVLTGALGVSRKRHHSALGFILRHPAVTALAVGAAGAAYQAWQSRSPSGPVAPAPSVPPPLPPRAPSSDGTLRALRVVLAAAQANGSVTQAEMQRIASHARDAGAESLVMQEMTSPKPLAEIVAGADDATNRGLYALAFTIVRADEGVDDSERSWLRSLATAMSLDDATVDSIERDVATGIEAGK